MYYFKKKSSNAKSCLGNETSRMKKFTPLLLYKKRKNEGEYYRNQWKLDQYHWLINELSINKIYRKADPNLLRLKSSKIKLFGKSHQVK